MYVAIFPSNVIADFITTKGVLLLIYLKKIGLIFLHSSSITPISTSMPASLSILTPLPETRGFGSKQPTYTFFILCSIKAFAQGGVFP